jgi:hypothetical protein
MLLCAVGGVIAGIGVVAATDPIIHKLETRTQHADAVRYIPDAEQQRRLDDIETELADDA